MKKIGGFFDNFKSKIVIEIQNRSIIIDVIKKYMGINLEIDEITISSGIIRIKSSPIIKNEIFIKKDRILKDINQKIHSIKIIDIK